MLLTYASFSAEDWGYRYLAAPAGKTVISSAEIARKAFLQGNYSKLQERSWNYAMSRVCLSTSDFLVLCGFALPFSGLLKTVSDVLGLALHILSKLVPRLEDMAKVGLP